MSDIIRPIEPFELTQGWGVNVANYTRFGLKYGHNGWDFRTKFPDTPQGHRYILAPWLSDFYSIGDEGNDGFGKYFETIIRLKRTWKLSYAHCLTIESFTKKNEGESQAISDNTGNSSGSHLHLTVKPGVLNNGKFISESPNNGMFGAVNPQQFFDELREFKKNSTSTTNSPETGNQLVITNSTKIPQINDWEVQKIKSEIDRIPSLERDLRNEREVGQRLIIDLGKAVKAAKEFEDLYKQAILAPGHLPVTPQETAPVPNNGSFFSWLGKLFKNGQG